MESTVKERVMLFLKHLKIGQNAFEAKIGWSNGYISNTNNFSADKLTSILNEYPLLNAEWLLTGNGSMLKSEEKKNNEIQYINGDFLINRLEILAKETGKLYSVKIEPEAAEIIRKYPGKKQLLSFLDNYNDHKDFVHRYNNNLKEIGPWEWKPAKSKNGRGIVKKIRKPLFPFISSYYSRHSWATIASGLDISKDVISAALGHGKKTVTDIYIKFDMRKVDAANRRIIDLINAKK